MASERTPGLRTRRDDDDRESGSWSKGRTLAIGSSVVAIQIIVKRNSVVWDDSDGCTVPLSTHTFV